MIKRKIEGLRNMWIRCKEKRYHRNSSICHTNKQKKKGKSLIKNTNSTKSSSISTKNRPQSLQKNLFQKNSSNLLLL